MNITYRSKIAMSVYEYVAAHPGSIAPVIAKTLGLPPSSAQWAVRQLEKEGLIESEGLIRPDGRGYLVKPYRVARRGSNTAVTGVIRRAQHIGHPFGILAAQVMV